MRERVSAYAYTNASGTVMRVLRIETHKLLPIDWKSAGVEKYRT